MKQKNIRMVAEVNKLIGNTLLKDGGLYLPEIGSLFVDTTLPSIESASKGEVAPSRSVEFTSEERCRSLILTIAERGNCTPQQAALIYNKWREGTAAQESIAIDGVGVIANSKFSIAESFKSKLNPIVPTKQTAQDTPKPKESHTPADASTQNSNKRVSQPKKSPSKKEPNKKSSRNGLYIVLFIAALCVIVGLMALNRQSTATKEVAVEQEKIVTNISNDNTSPKESASPKESVTESKPTAATPATPKPTAQAKSPKEIFAEGIQAGIANSELSYKVICGAYSNAENVAKAIAIAKRATNNDIACTVYPHGKSFIVSIYDTNNFGEAEAFVKSHNSMFNNTLWINKR